MSRPRVAVAPIAVVAGLVAGALAACAPPPENPAPLLGAWTFDRGGALALTCQGIEVASVDVGGTTIVLRETTSGGIEIELGCRCRVQMAGDGRLARAGQSCSLVMPAPPGTSTAYDIAATVDAWDVAPLLGNPERLASTTRGTAFQSDEFGNSLPSACSFSIQGDLTRAEAPAACGADETAVGVLPYFSGGGINCPVGAGRDGLRLVMPNDNLTGCAAQSGNAGEDRWVYPGAVKVQPPCRGASNSPAITWLSFCRVDGALFAPADDSYAVLMLGDSCPAGAERVSRFIDNDSNTPGGWVGDIRPSTITGGEVSVTTTLVFCLFPPASAASRASSFPALGFPYAVFHDFDAPAPGWILSKRWLRSDDESDSTNSSHYRADGAQNGDALIERLSRMVEGVGTDTTFDMARVR
jgi:hypothetical protein